MFTKLRVTCFRVDRQECKGAPPGLKTTHQELCWRWEEENLINHKNQSEQTSAFQKEGKSGRRRIHFHCIVFCSLCFLTLWGRGPKVLFSVCTRWVDNMREGGRVLLQFFRCGWFLADKALTGNALDGQLKL